MKKMDILPLARFFKKRAIDSSVRRNIKIKHERKEGKNGRVQTVYLDIDLKGFAVHIVQL
jgi:hypothetical protein